MAQGKHDEIIAQALAGAEEDDALWVRLCVLERHAIDASHATTPISWSMAWR